MITKRIFLLVFLSLSSFRNGIGKEVQTVQNLKPQWRVYSNNQLRYFNEEPAKAIHFSLELLQTRNRYLQIESSNFFYLFINDSYVTKSHRLLLSADSLKRKYSSPLFISLYQPQGISDLETCWASSASEDLLFNPKLPARSFSNFLIVATLILITFFTSLFGTNPQLTLDYLDFTKLFFFKDREESQITLRITSSVNLLFYVFCSLLTSLALITASHYSNEGLPFSLRASNSTTGQRMLQWIFLAFAIFGFLMAKLVFGVLMALLYNWRDVAGFQFFNFVRVLILSLALIAIVSIFGFSLNINVNYFNLLKAGSLLLAMGVGLLYFKLLTRTSFRSFHLFSYLCATEIFPLMILIKVLLF